MNRHWKLAITLALALSLGIGGTAIAGPGLDPANGLTNGSLDKLRVNREVGVGSGAAYCIWNGATYSYNVYWTQPELHLEQGSKTWDVFALCVDPAHLVNSGTTYTNYEVRDYASGTACVQSQVDWNKLTYMWSKADVTSDADRTALQLATWKGCAGDWNIGSRNNFWTTADGSGVQFWLGNTPGVAARANEDLNWGLGYDGTQGPIAGYKLLTSGGSQNFATTVPEPGTILAAFSILAPVGFVFRRKRA